MLCIGMFSCGQVKQSGPEYWLTTGDQQALLQKQAALEVTAEPAKGNISLTADTSKAFQSIDGFGYTLTGGSAQMINAMPAAEKKALLQELFGNDSNAISISYLRISVGASDLNAMPFTYADVPGDTALAHFSLAPDKDTGTGVIPLLREILAINPGIKILASPWSPPAWMKDNNSSKGGSLQKQYYGLYARYFVKYVQAMKAEGIPVDALTPQNEPLHPGNNPSLLWLAEDQRDFIKNDLGPAFEAAGIKTKIVVYDHNCDRPDYPMTILADSAAARYVNGSAFHLYAGDVSALSTVHNAYPGKALYFTEQWTGSKGVFGEELRWHMKNVIIGTMRNWSRIALEWNLASDSAYKPHTPGGCNQCKGALTITGGAVTRNVAYYIIAHASKFITPGSVRIDSHQEGPLYTAAFLRPDGKTVMIILNDSDAAVSFNLQQHGKWVKPSLPPGSTGTFIW